jgi:hypothetical protein
VSADNRKLLRLRRDDVCADCGGACPRGTEGWWYPDERVVRCRWCVEGADLTKELSGTAGGSARAEGERRHERRREHLRSRFGRAAPVVEFLTDDPQSTLSWTEGGSSEARVGTYLERELAGVAVVLHDRRVPRSRANIDHVIVAPSGVWVVDSKARSKRVERRDKGPFWRSEVRLYVGGRDHTKHLAAMHDQRQVVLAALGAGHPPVHAALCFNGADWGMFGRSFVLDGVLVTWPGDLVEKVRRGNTLGSEEVTRIAARLAAGLPPAS